MHLKIKLFYCKQTKFRKLVHFCHSFDLLSSSENVLILKWRVSPADVDAAEENINTIPSYLHGVWTVEGKFPHIYLYKDNKMVFSPEDVHSK